MILRAPILFSMCALVLCSAVLGTLSGCASTPATSALTDSATAATTHAESSASFVEGSASFRERMTLPPNTVFEAVLQDVSRPGAPATVLARDRVQPVQGPVISFRIPYDPSAIDPRMSYSVRATIKVGEQLWFTSDTVTPVLTHGAGNTAALVLKMVRRQPAAESTAAASLTNTYWRLTTIEGRSVAVRPGEREPHLVFTQDAQGRPTVRALFGCNTMNGSYRVDGSTLELTGLTTTLMACMPPLDEQEGRMKRLLQQPVQWRIEGQRMTWFDAAGRAIAEFEAVYLR